MRIRTPLFIACLSVLSHSVYGAADMVSGEKESLRIKYEEQSRRCGDLKGAGKRAPCNTKALNNYNAKLSLLSENPDLYFQNKYGDNPGDRSTHKESASAELRNGAYYVAYEDSKCAVLSNNFGYTLVEIYTGYPAKGSQVIGPVNTFGLEKFYNQNGQQVFTGYIDDFGMSEQRALEKIERKCRPR